ncbi:hypothetical protein BB8028_0001g00090 [Beauveria bassiana]|uniref:Uncharacterized protein n=1 Tax=Beauveria bassiana TaxID=176275 RepID=A0A2S7XVF6_BEABA|nr:hypothetical protein BB8028_0001g00090 [Beauveria bassiana]
MTSGLFPNIRAHSTTCSYHPISRETSTFGGFTSKAASCLREKSSIPRKLCLLHSVVFNYCLARQATMP